MEKQLAVLESLQDHLAEANSALKDLGEHKKSIDDSESPLESAKHDISLAFALSSLYFVLLNIHGKGSAEMSRPPIEADINRVKKLFVRLQEEEKKRSRVLQVDKEAAKRLIANSLDIAITKKAKL